MNIRFTYCRFARYAAADAAAGLPRHERYFVCFCLRDTPVRSRRYYFHAIIRYCLLRFSLRHEFISTAVCAAERRHLPVPDATSCLP